MENKATFDWLRFIKVQQNLPNVGKDGKGNYSAYMKLEDLNPAMLKVLNDNNFVWMTQPCSNNGVRSLEYRIVDATNGAMVGGVMELVMDKDTPQAQGSAITYARRYALTAMTGLVADMDDDGQKATDVAPEPPKVNRTGDKSLNVSESPQRKRIRELCADLDISLSPDDKEEWYGICQSVIAKDEPRTAGEAELVISVLETMQQNRQAGL